MKERYNLQEHIYHIFCAMLLYCAMGLFAGCYYRLFTPTAIILLLGMAFVFIIYLLDCNKTSPILYIIMSILLSIGILLLIKEYPYIKINIQRYYLWACDELAVKKQEDSLFYFLTIFLIYTLCFPLYLLAKFKVSRFLVAIIGFIGYLILYCQDYKIDRLSASFFFVYIFLCLVEFSITRQNHDTSKKSQVTVTYLIPVAIAMLLLCCLLPPSSKPLKLKPIHTILNQFYDFGYKLNPSHSEKPFQMKFSGYTDNGKLGGRVIDSKKVELSIKDNANGAMNNIYLVGNVKNEFVGDGWTNTVKKDKVLSKYNDYELQLYELVNFLYLRNEFPESALYTMRTVTVTQKTSSTNAVFAPTNMVGIQYSGNKRILVENKTNLSFTTLPKDKTYKIDYLNPNINNIYTDKLLRDNTIAPYKIAFIGEDKLNELIKQIPTYHGKSIKGIKDILQYRTRFIKDNYLSLPKTVSEKVIKLAHRITQGANSDYEKLQLLQNYLNSYTYTKQPLQPPEDSNFLDFFLFESKEGYCTYTATAMAILCRCVGIPSRYVQGYCIQTKPRKQDYNVLGSDAHAWCEAYLEGIGWITLEPTARYHRQLTYNLSSEDEEYINSTNYYDQDMFEAMYQNNNETNMPQTDLMHSEQAETQIDTHNLNENFFIKYKLDQVLLLVTGLIIVCILLLGMYHYKKIRWERKEVNSTIEGRMYLLLRRILFVLSRYHLCTEENPTLLQQFESLQYKEEFNNPQTIEVANTYMRLCYSDTNLSESDERMLVEFYNSLLSYERSHNKLFSYRFLLLRIKRIRK